MRVLTVALILFLISCTTTQYKELAIDNVIKIKGEPVTYPWKLFLPVDNEDKWLVPNSCVAAANILFKGADDDFISLMLKAKNNIADNNYHINTSDRLESFLIEFDKVIQQEFDMLYYESYLTTMIQKVYKTWVPNKNIDDNDWRALILEDDEFSIFFINSLIRNGKIEPDCRFG